MSSEKKEIAIKEVFDKYSENWGNGDPLIDRINFECAVLEILDFMLDLKIKGGGK